MTPEGVKSEYRLNPFTAQFCSSKTEAAYQSFIAEGDHNNNLRVLLIALPIFPCYALMDYIFLGDASGAVALRLAATVFSFAMLYGVSRDHLKRYHQVFTLAILVALGLTVNAINYLYADLSHAYYVGLIQGCVFACFLLRISFFKTMFAQASYLAVFAPAVFMKTGESAAGLQSAVLLTMVVVCGIGNYILQRFRRYDFQKVLIIEEQNRQLSGLLATAEKDNERKIAALNMLVHFIKTPLHQISGFSEILVRSAEEAQSTDMTENAAYIRNATANLTQSVNSLLAYHRLDEASAHPSLETVSLDQAIDDFREQLGAELKVDGRVEDGLTAQADPEVLRAAMLSLAAYYNDEDVGASRLTVNASAEEEATVIVLRDDGRVLSGKQFEELTLPLTKIDAYLGQIGEQMEMDMRTFARAVEIMNGEIAHEALADGNRITVTIPTTPAGAMLRSA
ncbi:MAG: histidine kinase dimerization/phospho-acceptor domain-containing protein [Pseudomonadota bacterium]